MSIDPLSIMSPNVREQYLKAEAELEASRVKHTEELRCQLGAALVLIGEAVHRPRIARDDLEQAIRHLHRALSIAAVLDPEA
jgi:hypothetical protein